ncbi:MAG TPA: PA domain-containing protein [Nocardioides sp.]
MSSLLRRSTGGAVTAVALAGLLALGANAYAHDDGTVDDGVVDNAEATHGHHSQHGGDEGHLPATGANVSVVGRGVVNRGEGRIADVGVFGGYAYLTAFRDPRCQQGGVHVMDIRDVTAPEQVTFIPTSPGSYAGEGSQVIHIDTPAFEGDVLAFNNEICGTNKGQGGMTLVDVSDPAEPKRLVEHAGDRQADGSVHEIHSVFMWDAGDRAYAVIVDDEESTDVDIMDITDPRHPTLVAEYDLAADFPQIVQEGVGLDSVFNHDMVVKEIDGRQVMLVSYWDGGYVTLDVTDPAKATYIGDSDFATPDSGAAEHGLEVAPEGNAHQAEFTGDDEFILAADEDFGPYKPSSVNTSDGTSFTSVAGSGAPGFEPGAAHDFSTVFVGLACAGSTVPPAAGPDVMAVVERGVCSFTEKFATLTAAGYQAGLVFNREGSDGCSDLVTMAVDTDIPASFVGRDVGFDLFDTAYDEQACRGGSAVSPIAVGTVGDDVRFQSVFDGWGYVRLFRNGTGKLDELDTYALPQAFDEQHASGSGDLSVHEVATSHERDDLAYISYYAGGLRVVRVTEDEQVEEVGHFIDQEGNNFWGVEVFEQGGKEYVAASDRDSGLYIFEYTGTD